LYVSVFFALTILLAPELLAAQSSDPDPATRAGQIQNQRIEHLRDSEPEEPSKIAEYISKAADLTRHVPLELSAGGLGPGAGFALSSRFEWRTPRDQARFSAWGMVLLHAFYSAGTGVELPNLTTNGLSVALEASHSDAPQLEYYGPGPNSSIHNQTNYRREDTLFDLRARTHVGRHFTPACRLGELLLNVGPGTNGSLPTTQSVFGPAEAPGIDVQSDFLIGECSAELDFRDFPGTPHRGTYAAGSFARYDAQDDNHFSFNRLSAAGEQFFPFLNEKRVIALRALTELTFHSSSQVVPFYLQSTLGSDTDLRGFRRYRFYDENLLSMNAEYRWEIGSGIDMAIFADAGRVFHRPADIGFSGMRTSEGFGLRFKNQQTVFARLDIGFSEEGVQIWFKFAKPF
jgi:outer membrane protein assembly factor BamA